MKKPKLKIWLVAAAAALPVAVLIAVSAQREAVLAGGKTVYLKTRPVDPRDAIAGDYAQLSYDIGTIGEDLADESLKALGPESTAAVYLVYETDARGLIVPLKLTARKPAQGENFVRGKLEPRRGAWQRGLRVHYGIEKYFARREEARKLERASRVDGTPVPLEMEARAAEDGTLVLCGYRRSAAGMDLAFPKRDGNAKRERAPLTVRITNASDAPIRIVDPPEHGTLRLEIVSGDGTLEAPPAREEEAGPGDVKTVEPGKTYEIRIDLMDARFRPGKDGKTPDWNDKALAGAQFRLVYEPPAVDKRPADAQNLYEGRIESRIFRAYEI